MVSVASGWCLERDQLVTGSTDQVIWDIVKHGDFRDCLTVLKAVADRGDGALGACQGF